jgi:hypothetical protein
VVYADGKVYGTGWALDVSIFDVATPTSPQLLGTGDVDGAGLALVGSTLYVLGFNGFSIVNVANPSSPVTIGSVGIDAVPGAAAGVAIQDTRAYLAPGYDGLAVVNIGNPYSPQTVGQWRTVQPYVLALDGRRLTLIGGNTTTVFDAWVVDVTQQDDPQVIGHAAGIRGDAQNGVATQGDYAYVATGSTGLVVLALAPLH